MLSAMELLGYLKGYPVFNSGMVRDKAGKSSDYTNLLIHRLVKRGLVYKIEKGKYTVFKDAFLIASRIAWPSYISCWSALKYHNLTEQVPHDVTVLTTADKKAITFNSVEIRFCKLKPKFFFGYEKAKYAGFEIFVADVEKSVIDSALLGEVSFSELKEIISNNLDEIRVAKFIRYLKKVGNRSLIKRFGYTFEALGKDCFGKLKKYVDATYVLLDASKKVSGNRNKKWRLIVNA